MKKNKKDMDPRFKIASREAVIGVILVIINFVWWFAFAYGMGSGPIANYSYVLGLPAWFFYSCVGGFILMVLLVTAVVKFYFKEVSFDDERRDES